MHSLFGSKHLILIGISLAVIVLCTVLTRKWTLEQLCKVLFPIGIVSELIKVFYYIIANEATYGGILPKTDLPFHLCSIQILFVAILRFSGSDKVRRVLYSFMLPSCLFGGLAAIAIATGSSLNGMPILSVQYFGYHSALVVFALQLLRSKQWQRDISDYFNCLKFLGVLMFAAFYINSMLYDGSANVNFMYVVSPPASGLPFLNEDHGWLVYIVHYAALVLVCVTGCYAGPILRALKRKPAETPAAQ